MESIFGKNGISKIPLLHTNFSQLQTSTTDDATNNTVPGSYRRR